MFRDKSLSKKNLTGRKRPIYGFLPLLALAFMTLFISGCDPVTHFKKAFPADADYFARNFIDTLVRGDIETAKNMFDEKAISDAMVTQLTSVSKEMNKDVLTRLELVRYDHIKGLWNDQTKSQFTYEYIYKKSFGVTNIMITNFDDKYVVQGFFFEPLDKPLSEINAFTLFDKRGPHYVMLLLSIAIPIFVIYTMVQCWQINGKRGIIWMLFMVLGIGNISINWTTGTTGLNIVSISSIWAPFIREGLSGAWHVSFALPVGSLVYIYMRNKAKDKV